MEGMLNYFVPEDGDTSDHLNVVPLPRVDQLQLHHVKSSFPLPGEFHFRFKMAFEGTYVWLDVVNETDAVPDFNGLVICKIARVQRESDTCDVEQKDVVKAHVEASDLIETLEVPLSPTKREEPQRAQKTFNNDLVGLMSDPVPPSTSQTVAAQSPDLSASAAPPPTVRDPFDVFAGHNTAPMRPTPISATMASNGPRGLSPKTTGTHSGAYVAQGGFNAINAGAPPLMTPQVPSSLNISQMHMGMGQPQGGMQQQNSFQGLQWQGMGQQQQPQRQRNPNSRQW